MARYAEGTTVTVSQSKAEIEKLLKSKGSDQQIFGESADGARVMFRIDDRMYQFDVPYPDPKDRAFTRNSRGYGLTADRVKARIDAEIRRRWRVLLIRLKVKFETVENGAATIQEEFLANLMLPDGSTMAEYMEPKIEEIYTTGKMPDSLPGLKALPGRSNS